MADARQRADAKMIVKAILLAAGRGRRLGELTEKRPKPPSRLEADP